MIGSFSIYIPFFSSCFGFSVFFPPLVFTSAKLYYLHAPFLLVNLFKQDLRHNSNELKRGPYHFKWCGMPRYTQEKGPSLHFVSKQLSDLTSGSTSVQGIPVVCGKHELLTLFCLMTGRGSRGRGR